MQIAISMKYGGQPINASDPEWSETSDIELGLICPNCKDAVRWVPERLRNRDGKSHKVKAHFSHYKAKDPSEYQCEHRISNYSSQDLRRITERAKFQRLKFLQTWFWEVISHHLVRSDCVPWDMEEALFQRGDFKEFSPTSQLNKVIESYSKRYKTDATEAAMEFLDDFHHIENALEMSCRMTKTSPEEDLGDAWRTVRDIGELARNRLHKLVVREVLDFIGTKRNYHFRKALILFLLLSPYEEMREIFKPEYLGKHGIDFVGQKLFRIIAKLLSVIPWADEFADLSEGKQLTRYSFSGFVVLDIIAGVEQQRGKTKEQIAEEVFDLTLKIRQGREERLRTLIGI